MFLYQKYECPPLGKKFSVTLYLKDRNSHLRCKINITKLHILECVNQDLYEKTFLVEYNCKIHKHFRNHNKRPNLKFFKCNIYNTKLPKAY